MPSPNATDQDPLADLDDDLGDDWESAFQSDDFMFSPDDEANDFFLFDENDSKEDVDELTSVIENAQKETIAEQQETAGKEATPETSEQNKNTPFPTLLKTKIAAALAFIKTRPLYQKAIIITAPALLLLLVLGTLFFKSTTDELAQTEEQEIVIADLNVGPEKQSTPITPKAPKAEIIPQPKIEPKLEREKTIRKQWNFPTFTIVNAAANTETLFIKVNLSLIAVLPEGASLPEEKSVLVKDIIYQFYQNRSPKELKRFALARGEMIHKLHNWLKTEWPDSPVNTVIFSKYQVVRAPKSS